MQRMICISLEQYNKMMESYDEAMKELRRLRRELRAIRYGDRAGREAVEIMKMWIRAELPVAA